MWDGVEAGPFLSQTERLLLCAYLYASESVRHIEDSPELDLCARIFTAPDTASEPPKTVWLQFLDLAILPVKSQPPLLQHVQRLCTLTSRPLPL